MPLLSRSCRGWLERKAASLSGVNKTYDHSSIGRLIVEWKQGEQNGLNVQSLLEGFRLREAYGNKRRSPLPRKNGRPWHAKTAGETTRRLGSHFRKGISSGLQRDTFHS